jgi:flagellar biosynthesis protein FlhG
MTGSDKTKNVIQLSERRLSRKPPKKRLKDKMPTARTRVLAITSGKGGVGKTNIVANLGYALSKMGKKVLILDADLGLGNLDVLLGLTPSYNISHVISGQKSIPEIIKSGPGGMSILPASSGVQELTQLSRQQQAGVMRELDHHVGSFDFMLIDTAAGISTNVMYFNISAQEIMVIVTPEPASITDAYALMKVMALKYSEKYFKLIVNSAENRREAEEVHRQLSLVADRFLNITIEYFGYIPVDKNVLKGIRHQKLVGDMFPGSEASRCFSLLAKKMLRSIQYKYPGEDTNFFWDHLIQDRIEPK